MRIRPPLHSILWSYLRIGASAFGGGMAALPVFEAELVHRRHWFTAAEVAEAYAISQSVPGVIIVNFAVLTGLRLSGRLGALLSAFVVALPAFVCLLMLAIFFENQWNNRWITAALQGLRPAVIALIAAAAIRLGKNIYRSPLLLFAAGTGAALMVFHVLGPVPLILIGVAAGLTVHFIRRNRERAP